MNGGFRFVAVSRLAAVVLAGIGIGYTEMGCADSLTATRDDAFYHQLLKLPDGQGYSPTRSFTIAVDTEHGNQLVAEDDPNLRFNQLWIEQFKPGYRASQGGAAFGELFRSYAKSAYKSYRRDNAQAMSALPDENGSIRSKGRAADHLDSMDYNLRIDTQEVRFKVEYNY